MSRFVHAYNSLLQKSPLLTKSITSFILWSAGDAISQNIDESNKNKPFDYFRTFKMSCFGALVFTPLAHVWYPFLATTFPGASASALLCKVGLDQTVFAFSFLSSVFVYTSVTDGKSLEFGVKKAKDNILDTLKANWMVWPAVQLVNFKFVPIPYQILVVNMVSIPWNTYVTTKANKK